MNYFNFYLNKLLIFKSIFEFTRLRDLYLGKNWNWNSIQHPQKCIFDPNQKCYDIFGNSFAEISFLVRIQQFHYFDHCSSLMNSVLATIKLDIGLDSKNPVIKLYPTTNISSEVDSFIREWDLSEQAHPLILIQIKKQLKKHNIQLKMREEGFRTEIPEISRDDKENIGGNVDNQKYQQLKKLKKKYKNTIAYTPIQRLKNDIQKKKQPQNHSFAHSKSNRSINNISSCKRPDRLGKCVKEKIETHKCKQYMTFGKVVEFKIRKIFRFLKGKNEEKDLKLQNMDMKSFKYEFLVCLEELFCTFKDEEMQNLNEQKFVKLCVQKNYGQKLITIFTKFQEE